MVEIRDGVASDLPALTEIYNHYVAHSNATFDLEPWSVAARQEWFAHYAPDGPHRLLVAVDGGSVVGYATSSTFRARAAYAPSVETSVYCDPSATGRGIGTALYTALLPALREQGLHRAYAGVALPNDASVRLHERFGFRRAGVFSQVGRKFDRWWDVLWLELPLDGTAGGRVVIVPPRQEWASEFAVLREALSPVLGPLAARIDHIGSTSVPGLAAKDLIDIQVGVVDDAGLVAAFDALVAAGWAPSPYDHDHPVGPLAGAPEQWAKRLVFARPGQRRTNVHLRVVGRANHRYALLFRDFLREHPEQAAAYGQFKLLAAELVPGGVEEYADLKDPVCDLVYLPAEEWADRTGWQP